MDLYDTIKICKAYAKLGWAVQGQLDTLLEDASEDSFYGLNINALAMIHEFLKTMAQTQSLAQGVDSEDLEAGQLANELLAYVEKEPRQTIRYGRIRREQ